MGETIDVEALRAKYSGDRKQLRTEYDHSLAQKKSNSASRDIGMGQALPNPVLMCQACQALGIVKKQYGYRVMDEQCERCGGEGVITQKPKPANEELQEKIKRVEALIEASDDLNELEQLEAALKERTLTALK